MNARPSVVERSSIWIVAAALFVNALESMLVVPLAPDLGKVFQVSTAKLAYFSSCYGAAAACSGLIGSFVLDRFDRRRALVFALLGLGLCTGFAGCVTSFPQMLMARFAAGLFAGPTTSLSFSIITDAVPTVRRGYAFGIVVAVMSLADAVGLPAALEVARASGWRVPFIAMGIGCVAIAIAARFVLPRLDAHIKDALSDDPLGTLRRLLKRSSIRVAYFLVATQQIAAFLVALNLSAYLQQNLGFPRSRLSLLYFVSGSACVVAGWLAGRMVDRFGSFTVGSLAMAMMVTATWWGFLSRPSYLAIWIIVVMFMFAMSLRSVAVQALISKLPGPSERGRFQSLQSAIGQGSMFIGATLSGQLLSSAVDGPLIGVWKLATTAIVLSSLLPLFMWWIGRSLWVDAGTQ